jgi:lipoate-protein ligase A
VQRVCLQLTDSPGARDLAWEFLRQGALVPVCVSATGLGREEVEELLAGGAERVALPLDAATPGLYQLVKGGPGWERTRELLAELARAFPGRAGTHLVVGLGETEEELLRATASLLEDGVTVALFAFTPIPGTPMAGHPRPTLASYRRIQAGHFLLRRGAVTVSDLRFEAGRLASVGLTRDSFRQLLAGGEAFRTSGCPGCNRPYYNERPGQAMYNYPRPLSPAEAEAEVSAVVDDSTPGPREAGVWRLLETGAGDAAWNMAVDEALARVHARGDGPPTLRLYTWDPPAVSVGYAQALEGEVDLEACRRAGVHWVRRPTGGRAILHEHELTYSLVIRQSRLPGPVPATYGQLARGLAGAMRQLGLEPTLAAPPARAARHSAACFDEPSAHELLVAGKKVLGSAQVRREGVILQHGSWLLQFSPGRLASFLPGVDPGRVAVKAAGVSELLGRPVGAEEAARAFREGFARGLGITLEPGVLTGEELRVARELLPGYAHPALGRPGRGTG